MDKNLESKIVEKVNSALDSAEEIWKKVALELELRKSYEIFSQQTVPSQIPDYPFITEGKPEVANFIAFILDIRNSTKHLICAYSGGPSQLQRVFYETTAINTAGAIVIKHYNGGLTEYLGDGFLALFKINNEKEPVEVYKAYNAAKSCIDEMLVIVNNIIEERYKLPKLEIGIGMAYSKAIVTLVGIDDNLHPKAIGECVYRASKLSSGSNQILIDDRLEHLWPSEKGGKLHFSSYKSITAFDAYSIAEQ